MKSFDKKWEDMGTSSGEDAKKSYTRRWQVLYLWGTSPILVDYKSYTCQNALGVGIPTTNIFAYGIF